MKSKLILLYVFSVCSFGIFPASSADLLDAVDSEIYWSLAEIEYEVESLVPLLTAKADPAMDEASIGKHIT